MMPELRGDEFFLQATDQRPDLADRFIFITGYAADPKVNVFLTKSGCKYLIKPFPVQVLIDSLRQMLA
jgi:FixJ family two-component response regulator